MVDFDSQLMGECFWKSSLMSKVIPGGSPWCLGPPRGVHPCVTNGWNLAHPGRCGLTCKEVGSVDQDLFLSLSEGEKAGARGTCYTYIFIYTYMIYSIYMLVELDFFGFLFQLSVQQKGMLATCGKWCLSLSVSPCQDRAQLKGSPVVRRFEGTSAEFRQHWQEAGHTMGLKRALISVWLRFTRMDISDCFQEDVLAVSQVNGRCWCAK